jgi:orotate phosphoribosyltransferase
MKVFQEQVARKTAEFLIQTDAVKLSPAKPFKWASGWNSPIYCDNRLTLSYPNARNYIKNQLISLVINSYPEVEAIAGVATAGIPQGALVADEIGLPFLYVRSEAKDHGMQRLIEGKITPGQKVVVVEDLISTGGSSMKAVQALKNSGFEVLGMVAVFTYGFEVANQNIMQAHVEVACLCDYSTLIQVAVEKGLIAKSDLITLENWRQSPESWSAVV